MMLQEIFAIKRYPQLTPDSGFGNKLIRLAKTYGWLIVGMIAIAPIIALTDKFVTAVLHHKSLSEVNRTQFQHLFKRLGITGSFITVCLVGPLLEELMFRFPLSFKKRHAAIAVSIMLFYISLTLLGGVLKMAWVIIDLELIVLAILILISRYAVPDTPFDISPQGKAQFIIASVILFGLVHIMNYKPVDLKLLWLYPIYVIPQILMGCGITYIRFKNGFWWGVAMHCLINTVSTLLTLMVKI